ncbi:MAG: OmpH family outer membrane protein [Phycisphaerae bacterium]|jgi:Skp family chaperone for outer membrane proteins
MKTNERVLVYGGLAAALLLGLAGRLPDGRGSQAIAAGWGLKADAPRIATVDVLSLVERMISTDQYKSQREAFETEEAKKLQPLAEELKKMQEEAKDLKEESERFKALNKTFLEKNSAFQQRRSEATAQLETFNTRQVGEAYRLILDAATQLADGLGYTHVIASKSGAIALSSKNIPGAVQEMLARPVVKGVAADDLTERLMKSLKLENVTPPAPAAESAKPQTPEGGSGK